MPLGGGALELLLKLEEALRGGVLEFGQGKGGIDVTGAKEIGFALGGTAMAQDADGRMQECGISAGFASGECAAGKFDVALELGLVELEIIEGGRSGAGVVGDGRVDVIGFVFLMGGDRDVPEVGILGVVVLMAEFFVGEETFLDALEGAEVFFEVGDGFAFAQGGEEAVLDEGKEGLEVGFAMGLVADLKGGGELADGFGGNGLGMLAVIKFAECARGGGEREAAFGAGLGELLDDGAVGQLVAKIKNEGLVFLGKAGELVEAFHGIRWLVVCSFSLSL